MEIGIIKDTFDTVKTELLIVNFFKEDVKENRPCGNDLEKLNEMTDGFIQQSLERNAITGALGDQLYVPGKEKSILLIGSGNKEDYTVEELKLFSAQAIRATKKNGHKSAVLYPRGLSDCDDRASLLVEGIKVGDYIFDMYKGRADDDPPKNEIESIKIIDNSDESCVKEGEAIGDSVSFARDLINRPGNLCTPTILSEEAERFAKGTKLKVTVFDQSEIEKMNMGSFLSVARGSDEPPKFIVMHHVPSNKKSNEKLALVGKGLTFDTGGISLKPAANMHEMKSDMSGGAAVIGAMISISKLDLGVEVIGVVPSTENMPSGNANKPGDIVTAMNGKTIEVLNTDAEGRLILADALCYAVKEKATQVIDVATLTGACVVALGEITTGIMGNNQELVDQFIGTSRSAGEKIWQLPLYKKYQEQLKSDVADLANIGGRYGGAITAGAFLENFVDKTPWIHLDIAGTSWSAKEEYFSKGGTGAMVSSFVRYAKKLAS